MKDISAGPAVVEDGEIKAEVDQDMEKSPSKTGRASERNKKITDDFKKTNYQFVAKQFICVCVTSQM